MKAIWKRKDNKYQIIEKENPRPRTNELLVKVHTCGLCGSDLHKIRDLNFKQEVIMGHEIGGIIIAPKENKLHGKKVVINPLWGCNKCHYCKQGQIELCPNIKALGRNKNGGFAELIAIPQKNVYLLPDNFPLQVATLIDGLAVIIHGYNLIKKTGGFNKILIIGDGTIAALVSLVFPFYCKAQEIIVMGKHLQNLKLITTISKSKTYHLDKKNKIPRNYFDLVVETVGRDQSETINQSIDFVKPRGNILSFGVFPTNYSAEINIRSLLYKEVNVVGSNSFGYYNGKDEFSEAVKFVKKNQKILKKIITQTFSIEKFMEGVEIMNRKSDEFSVLKVNYNFEEV